MLPVLPAKWVAGAQMPFGEGTNAEFKLAKSFSGALHTSLTKYRETVCGFLNSGGGYLILGVDNKGMIVGMDEVNAVTMDKVNVWADSIFGTLSLKDGTPLNPNNTSVKVKAYDVEGTEGRQVVVVEALHSGQALEIMTKGGDIFYRLNASNYRLSSEPVYRKRDVEGMLQTARVQMQEVIDMQHKAMKEMQERHRQEVFRVMSQEKDKSEKQMREIMSQVSLSLYKMYHPVGAPPSFCSRLVRYVLCRR